MLYIQHGLPLMVHESYILTIYFQIRSTKRSQIHHKPIVSHNSQPRNPTFAASLSLKMASIKEESVDNFRRMRVVVIGAGYSGLYMNIRIPEWLRNVDLVTYEQNEGVGGTWWTNRYPGCACDIPCKSLKRPGLGCPFSLLTLSSPAHSYVYTFEPNAKWSKFYAPSEEIRDYLHGVKDKYSAGRFIKLKHEVNGLHWDAEHLKWSVAAQIYLSCAS